jgi:RNA polymerase-binding transcription factor DksA
VDAHAEDIAELSSQLDDVDRSLARLADDTYRTCEVCGEGLADEQLASEPTLRRCDEHRAPA